MERSFSGAQVLYVCNEDRATTKQRLLALEDLGIMPDVVFTYLLNEKASYFKRVKRFLSFKLGFFPERNHENRTILTQIKKKNYDIVFIEKGLSIKPTTLKTIKTIQPSIKLISYTLDDVMNRGNTSFQYKKSLPLYDFHFTNKKYNVNELMARGAKNVYYFKNAYSTHVHRPIKIDSNETEKYNSDVSFIGTFESERAELIRYLAENGIRVRIWGWIKSAIKSNMVHPNIHLTEPCIYDDEYAKAIGASKINLCFLRKANRDTETTRSVEIPACGGFMLAERTIEHLELFEEGLEAVYFDSKEELLEKIRYYLANAAERTEIATNGLTKCVSSKLSYQDQLSYIFSILYANPITH